MRIHELRLQNFRRFEDLTVKFSERFSVLVGDNGMGKTSVLDAVARVLNVFRPIGGGLVLNGTKDIRKVLIDGENRQQFPLKLEMGVITIDGGEYQPFLKMVDPHEGLKFPKPTKNEDLHIYFSELISASRTRSGVIFPLVAYYGTGRLWGKSNDRLEWTRKDTEGFDRGYLHCLSPNANPDIFLGWFRAYEWEVMQFDQPSDKALLSALKGAISDMVPSWEDLGYSLKDEGLFGIVTDESGLKSKVDFRELSDGYRGVIGMVADMAYRCIQLNPHLGENAVKETPGVVLIDELDLHLHPNWQRTIVEDLKRVFPKVQFIATTHSPFIVQSLREKELIILDDDPERGGDPYKRSIEDIAETEMGVEDMPRSEKFSKMVVVAEKYFQLISMGKESKNDQETALLRQQLNEFEEDFGEDPTFVAMLRLERKAMKL